MKVFYILILTTCISQNWWDTITCKQGYLQYICPETKQWVMFIDKYNNVVKCNPVKEKKK